MIGLTQQPKDATIEALLSHPFIAAGDAELCIRKMERFQKLGVDELICVMQADRIPHWPVFCSRYS